LTISSCFPEYFFRWETYMFLLFNTELNLYFHLVGFHDDTQHYVISSWNWIPSWLWLRRMLFSGMKWCSLVEACRCVRETYILPSSFHWPCQSPDVVIPCPFIHSGFSHVWCMYTTAVMVAIWGSFEMSVNLHQALVCRDNILLRGMEWKLWKFFRKVSHTMFDGSIYIWNK
jgi:hypothetical protein